MATSMKHSGKTILIYGLSGMQLLLLTASAEHEGITCRAVPDTQTSLTISQLLSGKNLPSHPPLPMGGKFALLDGFNGQEEIGTALINQVAAGVVKAVHTNHNDSWPFSRLCSAISEEQRTMLNLRSDRK